MAVISYENSSEIAKKLGEITKWLDVAKKMFRLSVLDEKEKNLVKLNIISSINQLNSVRKEISDKGLRSRCDFLLEQALELRQLYTKKYVK